MDKDAPSSMTKAIQNYLGHAARSVAVAFLLLGISFVPARAVDDVQRIVVVVNDAVVSEFDIRERIGLVMATTGQVSSEEQLELMRENVREMLIDEILQLQEALDKELTFTEAEVEERYAQLAASNNVSVSQFDNTLEQMGASKTTILSQMRASVAWEQVVDSQLRPFLAIAESEVDNYKNRMVANKGEPEYRIAEIFVTVPSADREGEAQATVNQLAEQIRGGANFADVARQFSDMPTGAQGGDMGWMLAEQINPDIREQVISMFEGSLLGPVRSSGGFSLYTLIDKRRVMMADLDETELDLQQMIIPINDRDVQTLSRAVYADVQRITRCRDIASFARIVKARDYGPIGEMKLGQMPRELKLLVENLEVGKASLPVKMGGDLRVLIVCGRKDPQIYEPSFEEIENFLTNQRLSMMSLRYMRDLRRDAIIDSR